MISTISRVFSHVSVGSKSSSMAYMLFVIFYSALGRSHGRVRSHLTCQELSRDRYEKSLKSKNIFGNVLVHQPYHDFDPIHCFLEVHEVSYNLRRLSQCTHAHCLAG